MSSRPLKASRLLQAHAGATTERKTPEITTDEELERAVARMRDAGTDITQYEMKEARGYPASVVESLCAFANTRGGVIILGVSETDFQPVDIDVKKLQARLASSARTEIEPAIQVDIRVLYLAGKPVVVGNVPELRAELKPCHVKREGVDRGSYIRVGDGDYRMSPYEIHRFQENEQRHAGHDDAIVSRATVDDLSRKLLKRWASEVSSDAPLEVAQREGVLAQDAKGELHPTLAGLLMFGLLPQRFFPRLNVVVHDHMQAGNQPKMSGNKAGRKASNKARESNERFTTITFNGPIPSMMTSVKRVATGKVHPTVSEQMKALSVHVKRFPWNAVREALINAFVHRDYSEDSRNLPILMDVYDDRLEIASPGGLFQAFSVQTEPSQTRRNVTLTSLAKNIPFGSTAVHGGKLSENAKSGWKIIEKEMLAASGKEPEIISTLHDFRIILRL